jgi:hypothetical protein
MQMIEGFEGPYAIELLASTHWVARKSGCENAHDAWLAIRAWTPRKGRLFTEYHVATAWNHIEQVSALASTNEAN